jgi:hypothetical protein
MTTTRVDIEEIGTTRAEKILAIVLAVFLLIGGIWTYTKIDDWVRSDYSAASFTSPPAVQRASAASNRLDRASARVDAARRQLELKREAYRTALEAKEPAARLAAQYHAAEASYARALAERRSAQREVQATRPAAERAERDQLRREDDRRRHDELIAFLLRFALDVVGLALGLWLMLYLHARRSRYLPNAVALVGAATVLALVLAGDYATDYIAPLDLGPILLSVVGSALTLVVFALLQRYIARRAPARRVRRGRCPFCGYPTLGAHCEGCGRAVVGSCARCGEARRIGVAFCAACGADPPVRSMSPAPDSASASGRGGRYAARCS